MIIEIYQKVFEAFICCQQYLLETFTWNQLCMVVIVAFITLAVTYKVYSFLYVFSDEFRV